MRLRYLHLPDYGPLQNIEVVFERNSFMPDRLGEINFVVGLNGSGKSGLLRAVYDIFHSLCREELPKFPVTLAYDIHKSRNWTVVFHRPAGPASNCFLVPAADELDFKRPEEWQYYILNALSPKGHADSLGYYVPGDQLKGNGNLRNWLPSRVLAYTSGDPALWQDVAYPSIPTEELRDDPQEFNRDGERPKGWTAHDEEYDGRIPKVGDPAFDKPLKRRSENPDAMDDRCLLLLPKDIELAAVSLGIWQAAIELNPIPEEHERNALREKLIHQLNQEEQARGARRILNEVDWLWPTHAAFRFSSKRKMAFSGAAHCFWLHALADSVIRQPLNEWQATVTLGPIPPIDPSALVGNEELPEPLPQAGEPMRGARCGAEALRSLFGGEQDPDETLWSIFETLRFWREAGLLKDVLLTVKRIYPAKVGEDTELDDRVLCYSNFSDGEQMLLGRMALLFLLKGQDNTLLLLDEPETHFNDAWKRQIIDIVDDNILKDTRAHVLVATHTSLALTDVFRCEITKLVKRNGVTEAERVALPTFGSDPGRILLHVFDAPDIVGARAIEFISKQLTNKRSTPAEREELERLVTEIGNGWPRARLMDILDKLNASSDS